MGVWDILEGQTEVENTEIRLLLRGHRPNFEFFLSTCGWFVNHAVLRSITRLNAFFFFGKEVRS